MAMTNQNQNPAPASTLSPPAKAVLEAADNLKKQAQATEDALRAEALQKQGGPLDVAQPLSSYSKSEDEADLLSSTAAEFRDQVIQEEITAAKVLAAQVRAQTSGEKNISDLCEEDAYNLEIAISAKGMSSPDFLK